MIQISRENRIKDYTFSSVTPGSPSNSAPVYSDHVLNGELLKVEMKTNALANGSLFVRVSGSDELLWQSLAGSSALLTIAYPMVYTIDNVGGAGSPEIAVNRVFNAPIYYAGSGWDAGSMTRLTVFYR